MAVPADLAVALGGVPVAEVEQRAGTVTGRYSVEPGDQLLAVDVAAASARGGTVECSPGSAGGRPMTPRNGASGRVDAGWRWPCPPSASISHSSQAGWAARPGRAAGSAGVSRPPRRPSIPSRPGVSETSRTASTSPGCGAAHRDRAGQAVPAELAGEHRGGLSSPGYSCRFRWPAASSDRTTTVSPGSTVSARLVFRREHPRSSRAPDPAGASSWPGSPLAPSAGLVRPASETVVDLAGGHPDCGGYRRPPTGRGDHELRDGS